MLVGVPTGVRYSTTISKLFKGKCTCEKCSTTFDCDFYVTGSGSENRRLFQSKKGAPELAKENAATAFEEHMQNPDMLPLPCPSCGWYQKRMNDYHKWTIFPSTLILLSGLASIVAIMALLFGGLSSNIHGHSGFFAVLHSPLLWGWLGVPSFFIVIILLLRRFSDLNRKHPLISRIKRP